MDPISTLLHQLATPSLPGIDMGLERMEALLSHLGNPHHRLPPTLHIAGTNGKGSLLAFLSAMMQAAGKRVHSYSSPHLVTFHERITLHGIPVSDSLLLPALQRVQQAMKTHPATFFEATTAAAFLLFSETPADFLILETGMGGRLDATNVIATPALTAITPISFDHEAFLGNTLTAIATEKAGILKAHTPCVVGPQPPEALAVIRAKATALHSPLILSGQDFTLTDNHYHSPTLDLALPTLSLYGPHQPLNAATAIACAEYFGLPPSAILSGLTSARHLARMQRLAQCPGLPTTSELWLDGGHNPAAAHALAAIAQSWQDRPLYLLTAMMEDKDHEGFLRPLAPYTTQTLTLTVEGEARSASAETLARAATRCGHTATPHFSFAQAAETLAALPPGRILIAGSLYLAGYILSLCSPHPHR